MYRNYSDRVEKINEALRGMLSEQGKYKMYDPKTRTVVDSDAPGANRVFGEGEKAYIMQGSKKVYLNRPSYNKPLIDAPKTEPTKALATTVPAEGKLGTVPTGMSAPVVVKPAMQPEKRQAAQEPKATEKSPPATKAAPEVPVAGLRGQLMTMPEPAPQEKKSRVATSKEDMNKALEAVYKYGSTKEMPLASRSELEGFTKDDIQRARQAAIAPKPQPKPMTGGRGKFEMEPMLPESMKNYTNYLDNVTEGFGRKARRREGAKAAREAKAAGETPTQTPAQQQIAVPGIVQPTETNVVGNAGELAARNYLKKYPRKTGLVASILRVMGRSK
jgi:hypothetical protein